MNPSPTGLLLDTRPQESKEFKARASEIFTSPSPRPFSYHQNRQDALLCVGPFALENQTQESSCVAHSRALTTEIYRHIIKGQSYVQPAPAFIYKFRSNAPEPGMIAAEANNITKIYGVPPYADFPTPMTDGGVDAAPISQALLAEAKKNTVKEWITADVPSDIGAIAGITNGLNGAVSILIYATIEEWSLQSPRVLVPGLDNATAPVRHCVTVLPQSAYIGPDNKRHVIIQDSALFGGIEFRDVSEDWIAARCLRADYIADLENVSSSRLTPHVFQGDLSFGQAGPEVAALQRALQELGFFPSIFNGVPFAPTGQYFGVTKQAVLDFQNAHPTEILAPAGLTQGTGYFGASTRAFLDTLLSPKA